MIFSALYCYVYFHQSEIEILNFEILLQKCIYFKKFFLIILSYGHSWSFLVNISLFLGAIELSILAEYYGREIAAYDIQTARCYLYGQVSISNWPIPFTLGCSEV